ncbi:hypothetical protein Zmor_012082 [Zophobas morio]|uniref:Heat shock protein 70 n=1 Tax=Zophobas morio TaxID=2755281 RepID=A0AA38LYG5_9CUCU|nr:hypothetical protein Zmor_012082 [Zophobas morio]
MKPKAPDLPKDFGRQCYYVCAYAKRSKKKDQSFSTGRSSCFPKTHRNLWGCTNGDDGLGIVGIDLGTTYSCVGIYENKRVQIIPNDQGNRITPSYVAFAPDGTLLVGDAAKNQLAANPTNTIFDSKRIIGREWSDKSLQSDIKYFPFKVVNKGNKPHIEVTTSSGPTRLSPEEVSAMILRKMKEISEAYLNRTVTKAVVTVPAYFNDAQRRATKDAGTIAGLNVVRIINEPTAAAIAYGLNKQDSEKNILVYDLGGGTFDVSLLTIDNGVFEVIATSGDTHLGGQDFDQRVMEHFLKLWKKKYPTKADVEKDQAAVQKLRREVEKAKRSLSSLPEAKVEVESFYQGVDFSETLTRTKFEDLNADLFKSTLKTVQKVLDDASFSIKDVHEVILVGGSTRIPKIHSLVKDFFGGKELNLGLNPDEAVAYGAAVQGGILGGTAQDVVLLDVTPLTLGIETVGGVFTKLIPLNSLIPAQHTQTFSTAQDNQATVTIKVYEGERPLTRDNHLLGQFDLTGIPPAPRGVPQIEVTFAVDNNGILRVKAEEKGTGKKQEITITNDDNRLSEAEIKKMIDDAKKYAETDKERRKVVDARQDLENLAYRYKRLSSPAEKENRLSEADKDTLTKAAEEAISFLDNNPSATLDELRQQKDELEKVCNPIIASLNRNDDSAQDHSEFEAILRRCFQGIIKTFTFMEPTPIITV